MSSTTIARHRLETTEAAIFSRVWEDETKGVSPTVARHVLKLRFSPQDQARMHELAAKNQAGQLTPDETQELDSFVKVADLMALLQSKARQRLRKSRTGAARHG